MFRHAWTCPKYEYLWKGLNYWIDFLDVDWCSWKVTFDDVIVLNTVKHGHTSPFIVLRNNKSPIFPERVELLYWFFVCSKAFMKSMVWSCDFCDWSSVVRHAQRCSKLSGITNCQHFWIGSSYRIDCFYVDRNPCKLQMEHCISLFGCGQECPGMRKFFRNDELLISLEIVEFGRDNLYRILACSSKSMQSTFLSSYFSWVLPFFSGYSFLRKITKNNSIFNRVVQIYIWKKEILNERGITVKKIYYGDPFMFSIFSRIGNATRLMVSSLHFHSMTSTFTILKNLLD